MIHALAGFWREFEICGGKEVAEKERYKKGSIPEHSSDEGGGGPTRGGGATVRGRGGMMRLGLEENWECRGAIQGVSNGNDSISC